MADSAVPKTAAEAIVVFLSGTVVFALGFEGIVKTVEGELFTGVACLLAGAVLAIGLVYRSKVLQTIRDHLSQFIVGAVGLAGVILMIAAIVGFVVLRSSVPAPQAKSAPETTTAPIDVPPKPSEPTYISNLSLGLSGTSETPITVVGSAAVTSSRLRFFVEYSYGGTKVESGLIPLTELSDVPRGSLVSIPVVYRVANKGQEDQFYVGNPAGGGRQLLPNALRDSPQPVLMNIVIMGMDGKEQSGHFYFYYIPSAQHLPEPFVFFPPQITDAVSNWMKQ
jgi:hypothetical protein